MYLSKLLLTSPHLNNPYEIHRLLWKAFSHSPDHKRDFLFRVERRAYRKAQVLMQSQRKPKDIVIGQAKLLNNCS